MKYIKAYENIWDKYKKAEIIRKIKDQVNEWTYDDINVDFQTDYGVDIDDCPFATELAIIHQRKYVNELCDILCDYKNTSEVLEDFRKLYAELIEQSKQKIIDDLTKNPNLYSIWSFILDKKYLNIPEWITTSSKYNL